MKQVPRSGHTGQIGLPYAKGSETSRAAAVSMLGIAPGQRKRVKAFILGKGVYGATADEVQVEVGLSHQNGSARVSELAKDNEIHDSGRKRPTRTGRPAVVYIVRMKPAIPPLPPGVPPLPPGVKPVPYK